MDLSLALRTGYFTALNGNVSVNAVNLPIYDAYAIPEGVTYPYVLLSSQTESQRIVKNSKIFNVTLLIDIVTGNINPFGRKQSEQIAEQIENIINSDSFTDIDISANGYTIGNTIRESSYDTTDKNNNYYIYRKLIRYNHIISKN
jgi:hypothetical protein